MRSAVAFSCLLACAVAAMPATAAECPGNPHALGTSRTIVIDPLAHNRLGSYQYAESLPLEDKEVVITFDDGPLPPYSTRILDLLAKECVKATFFLVGKMARAFPKVVRRMHEEGHTLANHSMTHSYNFHRMSVLDAAHEIEEAHQSIVDAVGDPAKVSPFFRFPGLHRQEAVEQYLKSKGMMSWSVDFMADDWTRISASEIVRRALTRLEQKGKGILLLHDIKPATTLGLPTLLSELKSRGYKVVHVVPATADNPPTVTTAAQWQVRNPPTAEQLTNREPSMWPKAAPYRVKVTEAAVETPNVMLFGAQALGAAVPVALVSEAHTVGNGAEPHAAASAWPEQYAAASLPETDVLPVPAVETFRYTTTTPRKKNKGRTNWTVNASATASADITGSVSKSTWSQSNAGQTKPGQTNTKSNSGSSKAAWNNMTWQQKNRAWQQKNAGHRNAWSKGSNQGKSSRSGKSKNASRPSSKRQTGHQIQIPNRPQASLNPSP